LVGGPRPAQPTAQHTPCLRPTPRSGGQRVTTTSVSREGIMLPRGVLVPNALEHTPCPSQCALVSRCVASCGGRKLTLPKNLQIPTIHPLPFHLTHMCMRCGRDCRATGLQVKASRRDSDYLATVNLLLLRRVLPRCVHVHSCHSRMLPKSRGRYAPRERPSSSDPSPTHTHVPLTPTTCCACGHTSPNHSRDHRTLCPVRSLTHGRPTDPPTHPSPLSCECAGRRLF
jgi:hypothetical protein